MYLLGLDIGSSSVKASLLNMETVESETSAVSPEKEMGMIAVKPGWAEQKPEEWYNNAKQAISKIGKSSPHGLKQIKAIGITYQMHGLVLIDKNGEVLRPSIIWCDSRAVDIGQKAFTDLGAEYCLSHYLNSPGNFTASKFRWVIENEKDLAQKTYKMLLPGDYMAYRLTDEINTTQSGLSEGIMWDFQENQIATKLLEYYKINTSLIPDIVDTFSIQGLVTTKAARDLGIPSGIPVSYRAGDQPNNAFSLNVLKPGEMAATAGTSGVMYGVTDQVTYDTKSRVNTFLHVNNTPENKRLGVLLCINSTGILNAWLRHNITENLSYEDMNNIAAQVPVGSENLLFYPFGNGAERVLENHSPGAQLAGLNFNIHHKAHMLRAAQEGIVFALAYGIEILKNNGIDIQVIKAAHTNMFLSNIFRETLCGVTGSGVELYNTDGSLGAARGAGVGAHMYSSFKEAFGGLKLLKKETINPKNQSPYQEAYLNWKNNLKF